MRYTLKQLYPEVSDFIQDFCDGYLNSDTALTSIAFGQNLYDSANKPVTEFIVYALYGYFYDDLIAYEGEDSEEVLDKLYGRLGYDIAVNFAYWKKKYTYISKLLTTEDLSLLQTSKMTSSSNEKTNSASGTLQKTATTPTGVSTGSAEDSIDIEISVSSDNETTSNITTDGFTDRYTNAQQKFANAGRVQGERSGEVLREGSIDELIKVLEKLPSSFADEVTRKLQKHFIFDYDGEMRGVYDNA